MKNLALTIVVLTTTLLQAFAQQYVPMPTGEAKWNYSRTLSTTAGPTWYYRFILIQTGDDTVMNSLTYKKIMRRSWDGGTTPVQGSVVASYPDVFWGGIREDNKKVYLCSAGSSAEVLIYDFTVNVGDFVPNFSFLTGNATPLKVIAIDSVQIGGVFRKRFQVAIPPSTTPEFSEIEGMGSDKGLVVWRPQPTINEYYTFHCYIDTTTQYATNAPCSYIWEHSTPTSTETLVEKTETSVYPNPFGDKLTIETAQAASMYLYNLTGQLVLKQDLQNASIISTGALPSGLYLLKLADKNGQVIEARKLIKE